MTAVILTIQAMIVLALIAVVLLQRSDGAGGLGMGGGGGGGGGLMSSRGAATALTRTTSILAALFFANSLIFSLVIDTGEQPGEFLPIDEQGELGDDDFSDIVGTGSEIEEVDPFTLPDDLGAEEAPAPAPAEPQQGSTPENDEDNPQR